MVREQLWKTFCNGVRSVVRSLISFLHCERRCVNLSTDSTALFDLDSLSHEITIDAHTCVSSKTTEEMVQVRSYDSFAAALRRDCLREPTCNLLRAMR